MKLAVNGARDSVEATPGSYAVVERTWKTGDRLELEWPLTVRTEMLPGSKEWISVLWGPVVLAGELGTDRTGGVRLQPHPQLRRHETDTRGRSRRCSSGPRKMSSPR